MADRLTDAELMPFCGYPKYGEEQRLVAEITRVTSWQ